MWRFIKWLFSKTPPTRPISGPLRDVLYPLDSHAYAGPRPEPISEITSRLLMNSAQVTSLNIATRSRDDHE